MSDVEHARVTCDKCNAESVVNADAEGIVDIPDTLPCGHDRDGAWVRWIREMELVCEQPVANVKVTM